MATIHPFAVVDPGVVLGEGTVIRQFASVTGITVMGRDCRVSPFAMLHGPKFGDRCVVSAGVAMGPGFIVGDDVFIGHNVTFANDAWPRVERTGWDVEALTEGHSVAIRVEDGASIGANAVILPGVTIGAGAMIAAGAVVTRDVLPGLLWRRDGLVQPNIDEAKQLARRMRTA